MERIEKEQISAMITAEWISLGILALIIIGSFVATVKLLNNMIVAPLSQTAKAVTDYGRGMAASFVSDRKDEMGQLIGALADMQRMRDEHAKKQEAESNENQRIKQALDVCQANVMMADDDLNIVYLNHSVQEMLKEAQAEIKQDLPNFNVESLMGFNVDGFHKNPAHQRGMLKNLKEVYETQIVVGGRTFDLVATPVWNGDDRLGTVVEWNDITEELARQKEEQRISAENARTRQALDVCQANVMMADADLNIVYLNDSRESHADRSSI